MSRILVFAATAGTILMAACAERIEVSSVAVGGVVEEPPMSNVFPWEIVRPDVDAWRRVQFGIQKSDARKIHNHWIAALITFSNCRGESIGASEVFLGPYSLYQSHVSPAEFAPIIDRMPSTVQVSGYLSDSDYSQANAICAAFTGGNMAFERIFSDEFSVK